MTRIDFYILGDHHRDGPVQTACKLCDKALAAGHRRLYVHIADEAVAEAFDEALWTFREGSFISHERYDGEALDEPLPSVLIGAVEPPAGYDGVLLNLGLEVPPYFSRFERVLEIVPAAEAERTQSRVRYKFYRDRGYELATHNLA